MTISKHECIARYLGLCMVSMGCVSAETLDKKKILEIIQAAKQHKAIPKSATPVDMPKTDTPKSEPIIVYRKKESTVVYRKKEVKTKRESKPLIYGSLPSLGPASIELERKFQRETKIEKKEMLFARPQKNRVRGINTEAKKIEYD